MKTRNGFVSNSSSSSFVVVFPRKPRNAKDVQDMMFGNFEVIKDPYYVKDAGYTAKEIAETVFSDIKGQKPNSKRKIAREFEYVDYCDGNLTKHFHQFSQGIYETTDNLNYNNPEDMPKIRSVWKRNDAKRKKLSTHLTEWLLKDYTGHFAYCLSYADDSGSYRGFLEHGDIFRNLPHIRFSHH